MIIKARHHWFYYPFFTWYSRRMPRRDFSRVKLHQHVKDSGKPILMIGNHVSWWDGFLAHYINLELFHRRIHIMMLEEQLEKRMFLNKTGAYSIKKGARSALESLQYTAEILSDPGNMVVLYPQGSIHSITDLPVRFEKGWYRVFSYLSEPIQVTFYISLFDYFSSRKPELHLYVYDYPYEGKGLEEMEQDFNGYVQESIDQQKQWA
jgi:1-acyl-sn-glycerol-3-phosphate acyltransferase